MSISPSSELEASKDLPFFKYNVLVYEWQIFELSSSITKEDRLMEWCILSCTTAIPHMVHQGDARRCTSVLSTCYHTDMEHFNTHH